MLRKIRRQARGVCSYRRISALPTCRADPARPSRLLNSDQKATCARARGRKKAYLRRCRSLVFFSKSKSNAKATPSKIITLSRISLPDNVSCRRTKYQGQDLRRTMARCFMNFSPSNEPGELTLPIANGPKWPEKLGRHRLIKSDLLLP